MTTMNQCTCGADIEPTGSSRSVGAGQPRPPERESGACVTCGTIFWRGVGGTEWRALESGDGTPP